MKADGPTKIREPIVEGIFYPSDPERLRLLLENLLAKAEPVRDKAMAIISPHASYRYSGLITATAFKAVLPREPQLIIILGPIHQNAEDEVFLPEATCFRQPNGNLEVAESAVKEILAFHSRFIRNDIPHLAEHALEVQLPFIKHLFPKALILPILLGKIKLKTCQILAGALKHLISQQKSETLFVVSANMTSFLLGPAVQKESEFVLDCILKMDVERLLFASEAGRISSCGAPAIGVLLYLAVNWLEPLVLAWSSSAEANLDFSSFSQYAAVGFYSKGENDGRFESDH